MGAWGVSSVEIGCVGKLGALFGGEVGRSERRGAIFSLSGFLNSVFFFFFTRDTDLLKTNKECHARRQARKRDNLLKMGGIEGQERLVRMFEV